MIDGGIYYTARHLLEALQNLDDHMLDMPLVLVHGKELQKPNLVQGFIPTPVPIDQVIAESKKPSLLTLAQLVRPKSAKKLAEKPIPKKALAKKPAENAEAVKKSTPKKPPAKKRNGK